MKKNTLSSIDREKLIIENFVKVSGKLGMPISELDLGTYAKQMNNTADYPHSRANDPEVDRYTNPKHKGNKEERVNNLSSDRFQQDFKKKYPVGEVFINTNIGRLPFKDIRFVANHTAYALWFSNIQSESGGLILFSHDQSSETGYHIDNKNVVVTDDESKALLMDMLKYNKM